MAFLRCFHGILTLLKWHSYIASTAFLEIDKRIKSFNIRLSQKKALYLHVLNY